MMMSKDQHHHFGGTSIPLFVYRVASVCVVRVHPTAALFKANKKATLRECRAFRVAMGPSLAAAVCMVVCAVASALPLAKFFSFRSSTAVDTKQDDTDEPKEEKDGAGDDNDEWGIIHAPHSVHSRSSRVQLATTVHDVQVSLALAVTACRRSPPGLRVQRVRAKWTFSAVAGSAQRLRRGLQFVQAPMFAVHLVTLAQLEAYVADRLNFAAHRHSEYTMGSRLCWAPRLSISAPAAIAKPEESSTARSGNSFHPPIENRHEQVAVKPAKWPRARLTNIKPRYLNYEQSASYSTKRQANIERRRALQSSQHRPSKDWRLDWQALAKCNSK